MSPIVKIDRKCINNLIGDIKTDTSLRNVVVSCYHGGFSYDIFGRFKLPSRQNLPGIPPKVMELLAEQQLHIVGMVQYGEVYLANLYNPHERYSGEDRKAIEPTVERINSIISGYVRTETKE